MNNENLNRWSAIAQIVSSLAIVFTLVYLAVQTRQNTDAILSTTRQNVLAGEIDLLNTQIEYPEIVRLIQAVNRGEDLAGFPADDVGRTYAHVTKLFRVRENSWMQYNNGVLDDETWQVFRDTLAGWIRMDAFIRYYWEEFSSSGELHPGFIIEMNAAVARVQKEQTP